MFLSDDEKRLAKVGLKSGQFSIFRVIYRSKETDIKQLQNVLMLDQTTLSRNLKNLSRDGYIKFNMDRNDLRVKKISLTSYGKSNCENALPLWQEAEEMIVRKLSKNAMAEAIRLSKYLVKTLTN